jgi:hypothetical protein
VSGDLVARQLSLTTTPADWSGRPVVSPRLLPLSGVVEESACLDHSIPQVSAVSPYADQQSPDGDCGRDGDQNCAEDFEDRNREHASMLTVLVLVTTSPLGARCRRARASVCADA